VAGLAIDVKDAKSIGKGEHATLANNVEGQQLLCMDYVICT